jgi:TonB family protein
MNFRTIFILPMFTVLLFPLSYANEIFQTHKATTLEQKGDKKEKARILKKSRPRCSKAARNNKIKGTVTLRGLLHSSGKVTDISVVNGLGHGITEAAIEAAQKLKFIPAKLNGVPVSQHILFEFEFDCSRSKFFLW